MDSVSVVKCAITCARISRFGWHGRRACQAEGKAAGQSDARSTPASRTGLDGHVNYMLLMRNEREDLVAVDDLRHVDHHQPTAVHQQVVGRQVTVCAAEPGQAAEGSHHPVPQAGELSPSRPDLSQPRRGRAVRLRRADSGRASLLPVSTLAIPTVAQPAPARCRSSIRRQ